jgi:hypothetical protein
MSLKVIELQVSLPRTIELGKAQDQMVQKGTIDQHQISVANQKQLEADMHRSSGVKGSQFNNITDKEKEKQRQEGRKLNKRSNKKEQVPEAKHPYKGRHLDFYL